MAEALERLYADPATLGQTPDGLVVDEETHAHLLGLVTAQRGYDQAGSLHQTDVDRIEAEIRRLQEEKRSLRSDRDSAMSEQRGLLIDHEIHIREALEDPDSPIHPIFRAVLLAPEHYSGALSEPHTLARANQLAVDLIGLNGYLEEQTDTKPVVQVTYGTSPMWQGGYQDIRLDFGYTTPGAGMEPMYQRLGPGAYCGCSYNHTGEHLSLELPVGDRPLGATRLVTGRYLFALDAPDEENEKIAAQSHLRVFDPDALEPQAPAIPIPQHRYYDADYRVAQYGENGLVEVSGPTPLGLQNRSYCAVGAPAVKQALLETYGKAARAHQELGTVADMASFVANTLRIQIEPAEFFEAAG